MTCLALRGQAPFGLLGLADLDHATSTRARASGINARGQIVGTYLPIRRSTPI